jgi:hyperosmotically inducible protein
MSENTNTPEQQPKPSGSATEKFSFLVSVVTALAAIFGASVSMYGASLTADVQREIASESNQSKLVEQAISILRDEKSAASPDLREWAIRLINRYSEVKFSAALEKALLDGSATLDSAIPRLFQQATHESEQLAGDAWITTKVKAELLGASAAKGSDINIWTRNGVVTMVGIVENQATVEKVVTVAKSVKGVTDVDTRALKVRM